MVFDRGACGGGHERSSQDPGGVGFLNGVLDQRLVDDRQHLLRLCLGGREKAGTGPATGKIALVSFMSLTL